MNCPRCGFGVPDGMNYCNQCGANLAAANRGPAELRGRPVGVQRLVIGRSPECDVVFGADNVSGRHAVLERTGSGGYLIRDLGSSNGTFVNGRSVRESELTPRDQLSLGSFAVSAADLIRRLGPEGVTSPQVVSAGRPAAPFKHAESACGNGPVGVAERRAEMRAGVSPGVVQPQRSRTWVTVLLVFVGVAVVGGLTAGGIVIYQEYYAKSRWPQHFEGKKEERRIEPRMDNAKKDSGGVYSRSTSGPGGAVSATEGYRDSPCGGSGYEQGGAVDPAAREGGTLVKDGKLFVKDAAKAAKLGYQMTNDPLGTAVGLATDPEKQKELMEAGANLQDSSARMARHIDNAPAHIEAVGAAAGQAAASAAERGVERAQQAVERLDQRLDSANERLEGAIGGFKGRFGL